MENNENHPKKRRGNPNMIKGCASFNPNGRTPGSYSPEKREAIAIFKDAAPNIVRLTIRKAIGYTEIINGEEVHVPGNDSLLKEVFKKAIPDNLTIGLDGQTVKDFISGLLAHRPMGAKIE